MKDSGSETATTTSVSEPARFIADDLRHATNVARTLFNRGGNPTLQAMSTGNFLAPQSADTVGGLDRLSALGGRGPTRFARAGMDLLGDTLEGEFLDPEFLRAAATPAINEFVPAVTSQFGLGGRTGGGLAAEALGSGIGDIIQRQANIERGRQQDAMSLLPMMEGIRELPIRRTMEAGALADARGQQETEATTQLSLAKSAERRGEAPLDRFINRLAALIPGAGGTTTGVSQRPSEGFGFGQLLGSALPLALAPVTGGGSLAGNFVTQLLSPRPTGHPAFG